MVKSAYSLTGNGLRDWLIQRITAIYMLLYGFGLTIYVIAIAPITFELWIRLFSNQFVRIATFGFLLSVILHSWIGLWTIATDYIKQTVLRNIFYFIVFGSLLFFLIWGIEILWGVT